VSLLIVVASQSDWLFQRTYESGAVPDDSRLPGREHTRIGQGDPAVSKSGHGSLGGPVDRVEIVVLSNLVTGMPRFRPRRWR